MLGLLVALAVAQPPASSGEDVAVLAVVRDDQASVGLVESRLREALQRAGIEVQSPERTRTLLGAQTPGTCQTNVPCYGLLGRSLGVPIVVRVEASTVETDLAVFTQAIATDSLEVVSNASFVTQAGAPPETLYQALQPAIAPLPTYLRDRPETPATAKLAAPTAPSPSVELENVVEPSTPPPSGGRRLWALAPAGAGVLAAGVGALLLRDAQATHAGLVAESGPKLSADEAQLERARGERNQTLGWVGLVGGAALVGTGAALWFMPNEETRISATAAPGGVFVEGSF